LNPFDSAGVFRPSEGGARNLAVRGAGATILSGGAGVAIQIIATVTLARLLTPADFGVVAMVTTFSLLLVNFGLNGFTEVILQFADITHGMASNLFWLNLGVGTLLTVGFAAAGSLLAWFYHDPLVARVAVGTSLSIFFSSTSVQHLALLKRAMRFSAVSVNDVVARTGSVVVSILLAWAGLGYWALVAGVITVPLSTSIGAWILCKWVPGWPRRAPETPAMVRFAMNVYGRFTVNYFSRNTDNLLVGWRFNAQALGFYKKAYDLFALSTGLLVSPLANVAVSALSRFDPRSGQFRRYFLNSLAILAFVGMALGADLTLVGKDVIRLLLGPKWEESGRIFMFFGPGIGIMMLYFTHGWIHLSIGKADRWFRWGIVEFAFTFCLFIIGLHWGPAGVAVAWTASFWILIIPGLWYAGKPIEFGVMPMLAAIWKFVVASAAAGAASALILWELPIRVTVPDPLGAFERITVTSLLFLVLYLGIVIVLFRGFAPIFQLGRLVREMAPSRKASVQMQIVAETAVALDTERKPELS
jgi:O-antigen/teichoic acid export membrane protein